MKNMVIIFFFFILLFSCEKKNDLCEDGTCDNYLKIWKELFISRNNMTEGYFNEHIFPYSTKLDSYVDGKTFHVEYTIKIDWAEAKLWDGFTIWLDPSTEGLLPSHPLPRSTYLTESQINILVDHSVFSSTIHKIEVVNQLKFQTFNDALQVLKDSSGVNQFNYWEIRYKYQRLSDGPGRPLLTGAATINKNENKCMSCNLDLVTGDVEVINQPCSYYISGSTIKPFAE